MSTYINYLAWCAQANIPKERILSESQWQRQTAELYKPKCKEVSTNENV